MHPRAFVPTTVYVVFDVGLTAIAAVVWVVDQLYDETPDAVSVALEPRQIVEDGLTLIDTVGVEIVISRVAVLVHPFAFVPVTVYVVFTVGPTTMLAVV